MFKKIILITLLVGLTGFLFAGAVNRTLAKAGESQGESVRSTSEDFALPEASVSLIGQDEAGADQGRQWGANESRENGAQLSLPAADLSDLTAEEAEGLLFMREEEKLARDVYLALYEHWGSPVFQNISQSEETHMQAVKTLLDRYGLTDPAQAQSGVFSNPELQSLYDTLNARGGGSLVEAFKVGAAIEEIDILDLQERLLQTDNADIRQVYESLLNGSQNHLRAFVRSLLNQTGEVYQPQFLSPEAYQAIVNAATGGSGNGLGGSGKGGYRGGRP